MTVQVAAGPVSLDAGDFKHTHNGVTWGLKVRWMDLAGFEVLDVVIAEQVGSVWVFKGLAMQDSDGILQSSKQNFLNQMCAATNKWLAARFSGVLPPPPASPLPPRIVDIDKTIFGLAVTIVNGVPSISAGGI